MKKLPLPLLLTCVSLTGLSNLKALEEPSRPAKAAQSQPSPVVPVPGSPVPVKTQGPANKEGSSIRANAKKLLEESNFAELESLIAELTSSKARISNGSWKIVYAYEGFSLPEKEPQSAWQEREKLLRNWVAAYPDSIAAKTALADFLTEYAWNARGSGWASKVTQDGWSLFEARLKESLNVLDDQSIAKSKSPMWYQVRMTIALGQGWRRSEYDKLFEEAKAYEPEYYEFDTSKSYYLLPRWYGRDGEWEQEAEKDAKQPGSLGWETYARVVISKKWAYKNIFKESKASWPETQLGLDKLLEKYPDSLELLDWYAKLACLAEDRAKAKKIFQQINGRMDLYFWNTEQNFLQNQNWAFGE